MVFNVSFRLVWARERSTGASERETFEAGERKKRKKTLEKKKIILLLSLTFLLHLHHLGLGDALDQAELLLGRVGQGLDGVDAALLEALEVGRGDAELLFSFFWLLVVVLRGRFFFFRG